MSRWRQPPDPDRSWKRVPEGRPPPPRLARRHRLGLRGEVRRRTELAGKADSMTCWPREAVAQSDLRYIRELQCVRRHQKAATRRVSVTTATLGK
jgi:hypothetical protein